MLSLAVCCPPIMSPSFPSQTGDVQVASPHAIDLPVMKPCSLAYYLSLGKLLTHSISVLDARTGVFGSPWRPEKWTQNGLLQEFLTDRGVGKDSAIDQAFAVPRTAGSKPL